MPPLNETRFPNNEVVMQLGLNMSRTQVEELARLNGLEIISSETFGLLGRTVYRFLITGGGTVRGIIARAADDSANISDAAELPVRDGRSRRAGRHQPQGRLGAIHRHQAAAARSARDRERQERQGRGDRLRDRRPASRPAGRDRGDLRRAPLGRQDRASARYRHGGRDRVAPAPARRRARRAAARGPRLRREHRRRAGHQHEHRQGP